MRLGEFFGAPPLSRLPMRPSPTAFSNRDLPWNASPLRSRPPLLAFEDRGQGKPHPAKLTRLKSPLNEKLSKRYLFMYICNSA